MFRRRILPLSLIHILIVTEEKRMQHVSVRLATEADAAAILAIYAPYIRETVITFEYEVPDVYKRQP